jgi:hypothetical protein
MPGCRSGLYFEHEQPIDCDQAIHRQLDLRQRHLELVAASPDVRRARLASRIGLATRGMMRPIGAKRDQGWRFPGLMRLDRVR